jgi:hypothetical protein
LASPTPIARFTTKKDCKVAVREKLAVKDYGGAEKIINQFAKDSGISLQSWCDKVRKSEKRIAKAA